MTTERTTVTRRGLAVAGALVGALLLTACGGSKPVASSTTVSTTSATSTTPATTSLSTTTRTTTTATHKPKPAPRPTTRTAPKAVPKPAPPAAATCLVPPGVTAVQVVVVKGSGSSATVRACRRSGGRYLLSLGPYYGHVGLNGVTWSKREGDLKTPAGTYPLRGGFGVLANPGLAMGWFRVDANDVWVDDSGSSLYNLHERKPANGRWTSAEPLYNTPVYNYAQVIGYNEARIPGKGSAIFFHVDKGRGTAGCVSLPTGALLAIFQWERPGAVMSIS
jgi:L,D-peptidoglycan transpeptidase YkuD (ErfK/YbiS/YcfS/YnhG family)